MTERFLDIAFRGKSTIILKKTLSTLGKNLPASHSGVATNLDPSLAEAVSEEAAQMEI